MNPRVTVSPLRSIDMLPSSKKFDTGRRLMADGKSSGRPKLQDKERNSVKLPNKGRSFSVSEKSKDEDTSPGTSSRRRSRNMQLTSLFDSLSRFFSADTERRRRTAYVNATVSLAQASFTTRHGVTSVQPPPPQPDSEAPEPPHPAKNTTSPHQQLTPAKKRRLDKRPTKSRGEKSVSEKESVTEEKKSLRERKTQRQDTEPEKSPRQLRAVQKSPLQQQQQAPAAVKHRSSSPVITDIKTKRRQQQQRRGTTKNVRRRQTAKSENVEANSATLKTAGDVVRPAEMKDLMTADVADSESKLFHTAQTIAQQVPLLPT